MKSLTIRTVTKESVPDRLQESVLFSDKDTRLLRVVLRTPGVKYPWKGGRG